MCRALHTNVNATSVSELEMWHSGSDINYEGNMESCNTGCAQDSAISGISVFVLYVAAKNDLILSSEVKNAAILFGTYINSPGAYITYMCDANKIGIDWNPDDGSENIPGMCVYGGDVNVPDYIPTKPGYTFKGWKLIK